MSEPLKIEYLKPFIDATIASSARFRRVLIVLIIASVLAFGAFWNATRWSWLNSRLGVASRAKALLTSKEEIAGLDTQVSDKGKALTLNQRAASVPNLDAQKKKELDAAIADIQQDTAVLVDKKRKIESELAQKDYYYEQKWVNQRGFKTTADLKPYIDGLERARIDNVQLIRIPFFGVVFDVNDLGLLGGFTFVVILMWFRFSLWREYYNLRSTFKEARTNEDKEFCYKALAMSQVLTVPPALSEHQPKEKPWGKIVRILYFLPVTVQFAILLYDYYSFEVGLVVSMYKTVFGTSLGLCFLVLSGLLTWWCFRLSSEIDEEWENAARDIQSASNQGITPGE